MSWVHLCLSTHQSQGNSEDTQAVHELEVVDMKTKVDKFKPVRVAVEEGEVGNSKVWTLPQWFIRGVDAKIRPNRNKT